MKMSRRRFILSTAVAGGGVLIGYAGIDLGISRIWVNG